MLRRLAFLLACLSVICGSLRSGSALAIYDGDVIQTAPPWAAFVTSTDALVAGHIQLLESSCTGTIVAPGWVLTAAHCVFTEDKNHHVTNTRIPLAKLRVVLGRSDLSKGFVLGGQWTVTAAPVPSGWVPSTLANDVALLHLKGALPKSALPLALAPANFSLADKTSVLEYGYGNRTETYDNSGTMIQKQPTQRLFATKTGSYVVSAAQSSPTKWWLSRVGPSSILHGDSGGPWALSRTDNFIIGVQSTGNGLQRTAAGVGTFAAAGATNVAAQALHDFIVNTAGILTGTPGTIYQNTATGAAGLMGTDGFLHPIPDSNTLTCLQGRGHALVPLQPFEIAELPMASDSVACSAPITFDDQPVGTAISNQYASRGVVFSSPEGPTIEDDGANPTSPVLSPGPSFAGHLTMAFVSPVSGAPATVSAIDFDVGYIDDAGVTISWYDNTGVEIGSEVITALGIQHVELHGNGIAEVTIDTTSDSEGAALDNLSFGQ